MVHVQISYNSCITNYLCAWYNPAIPKLSLNCSVAITCYNDTFSAVSGPHTGWLVWSPYLLGGLVPRLTGWFGPHTYWVVWSPYLLGGLVPVSTVLGGLVPTLTAWSGVVWSPYLLGGLVPTLTAWSGVVWSPYLLGGLVPTLTAWSGVSWSPYLMTLLQEMSRSWIDLGNQGVQ